jgi:hypothetical protein
MSTTFSAVAAIDTADSPSIAVAARHLIVRIVRSSESHIP